MINFRALTDYIRTPEDDANDAAESAWKRRRNAASLRDLSGRLEQEARQRALDSMTTNEHETN